MSLCLGIGPHEGRELELMLKGEKKCALFQETVSASGELSGDAIPEETFAPYVQEGRFLRFAREFQRAGHTFRYVCFTAQDEAWRAEFVLTLRERFFKGERISRAEEAEESRVLGYTEDEIKAYL